MSEMELDAQVVRNAIRDELRFWFNEDGFELRSDIPIAISQAFSEWLEANTDRIIEAIANGLREGAARQGQGGPSS